MDGMDAYTMKTWAPALPAFLHLVWLYLNFQTRYSISFFTAHFHTCGKQFKDTNWHVSNYYQLIQHASVFWDWFYEKLVFKLVFKLAELWKTKVIFAGDDQIFLFSLHCPHPLISPAAANSSDINSFSLNPPLASVAANYIKLSMAAICTWAPLPLRFAFQQMEHATWFSALLHSSTHRFNDLSKEVKRR